MIETLSGRVFAFHSKIAPEIEKPSDSFLLETAVVLVEVAVEVVVVVLVDVLLEVVVLEELVEVVLVDVVVKVVIVEVVVEVSVVVEEDVRVLVVAVPAVAITAVVFDRLSDNKLILFLKRAILTTFLKFTFDVKSSDSCQGDSSAEDTNRQSNQAPARVTDIAIHLQNRYVRLITDFPDRNLVF